MPVVYLMGVRWEDAGEVAELIALKTFLNEFVAYEKLSEFIQNRITCSTEGHILSVSVVHIFQYRDCNVNVLSLCLCVYVCVCENRATCMLWKSDHR